MPESQTVPQTPLEAKSPFELRLKRTENVLYELSGFRPVEEA